MLNPRDKRERVAILDLIKNNIDRAKFAIREGNAPAHDKAMTAALGFLDSYPGLLVETAEAPTESTTEAPTESTTEAPTEAPTEPVEDDGKSSRRK